MSARITSFAQLHQHLAQHTSRCRVAVAQPADEHTLQAVLNAVQLQFVEAFLVGEVYTPLFEQLPSEIAPWVHHIPTPDAATAMQTAVQMVHDGEADVLMKGLVNTDDLLRHVLNKNYGLRPEGSIISHLAAFHLPQLERIVLMSDVAVIPTPSPVQRRAQLLYASGLAHQLGIQQPRVALLHFCEKVSEKFPLTFDYADLKDEVTTGEWGNVLVDGPIDLLCALSPQGLADKQLKSSLEGKADVLLFPDIETGNAVYKTLSFLVPDAEAASILVGTTHPVVLTSRGDSITTKINSLALAALQTFAPPIYKE